MEHRCRQDSNQRWDIDVVTGRAPARISAIPEGRAGVAGRMMLAGYTGGQTRREASGAEPVPAFPSHRVKNAGKRG